VAIFYYLKVVDFPFMSHLRSKRPFKEIDLLLGDGSGARLFSFSSYMTIFC